MYYGVSIYTEHQWKVTNDKRTLNKGALLVLPEQRTAVISAFIFVMYSPMYRFYRKWCSSWMKSWHEHQLFPLVSMGNRKVVVLHENWSLAFSIDGIIEIISMAFSWNIFQAYNRMFIFEKKKKKKMFSNFEKPQKAQNARAAAAP